MKVNEGYWKLGPGNYRRAKFSGSKLSFKSSESISGSSYIMDSKSVYIFIKESIVYPFVQAGVAKSNMEN